MVAGEVRNPERNVPLALLFGVGIVGFLYISVNAAIQYMLPAVAVAASPRPAVAAVSVVLGATGATLVTAGMALSIFVTLNGTIMSGARVPFAAARDGLFFKKGRGAESTLRHPCAVIGAAGLAQHPAAACRGPLPATLRAGHLRRVALLHDRRQHHLRASPPGDPESAARQSATTFRMWGYPVLPALFIAAAAVLLVYSYQSNLRNSLLGTAIILAGIPLFYFFNGGRRHSLGASLPGNLLTIACPHQQGAVLPSRILLTPLLQYSFPSGTAHMHFGWAHFTCILLPPFSPWMPSSRQNRRVISPQSRIISPL